MDLERAEQDVSWFFTASAPSIVKAQSYEPTLGGGEVPAPDDKMVARLSGEARGRRIASVLSRVDGYARWVLELAFLDSEGCSRPGHGRDVNGKTITLAGISPIEAAFERIAPSVVRREDASESPRHRSAVVSLTATGQKIAARLAKKNDLDHAEIAKVLGDNVQKIEKSLPRMLVESDAIIDEALSAYVAAWVVAKRDRADAGASRLLAGLAAPVTE